MQIINSLTGISAVVFGLLLYLWVNARRNQKKSRVTGKALGYSLAIVVVLFAISVVFPSSNNSSNETESSSSTASSSSKSSSESKTENDILASYSAKKLKKYNSALIDSLDEDQSYANDGKEKYNASLYIDTLSYNSRGLVVKVTSEFSSLVKDKKTAVAQYAQKLANTQVVLQGGEVSEESTPTTQVYYGNKKIGHSKMTNGIEFKWDKG